MTKNRDGGPRRRGGGGGGAPAPPRGSLATVTRLPRGCYAAYALMTYNTPEVADVLKDTAKKSRVRELRRVMEKPEERVFSPKSVSETSSLKIRWVDVERPMPLDEAIRELGVHPADLNIPILKKPNARGQQQARTQKLNGERDN